MKKVLTAIGLLALTSCINVSTDLQTTYPATTATSVIVIDRGERMPDEADLIGTVKATKYGDECRYDDLMKKAIKTTAAAGGNVLRINREAGDSCHELKGVIAHLPEGAPIPYGIAIPHPALLKGNEADSLPYVRTLGASPRQVVRFSAGPAWITSRMYTNASYDYVNNQSGMELAADMEFFGKKGLGLSLSFRGNHTYYGKKVGSITLLNLGACLAYSTMLSQRWRFDYAFGPGFGCFLNSETSELGINIMGRISAEYMLTPKFGIGADLLGSTMWMDKPDGIHLPDNESYGVTRFGLLIGARLYY